MSRPQCAFLAFLLLLPALACGQQSPAEPKDPVLSLRPPPKPASAATIVTPAGRIKLDVLVSDATGKPVFGLEPQDFKVLDDNQPRKILSFRSFDGITVRPDPPVEVILLLDTVNTELDQVAIARDQIVKFLRKNGGHLAQPISIMLLTGTGLRIQPRPSRDGNALVKVLNQVKPSIHIITSAMGDDGRIERFQLSVRALALIAGNEGKRSGRKILLWIGSGWPLLSTDELVYSARNHLLNFDSIISLSTKLREARIALYSMGGGPEFFYQPFLKAVMLETQAHPPNLALPVLAVESGGRSVALGNAAEMASQLDECIAAASAFYTLSFDPPLAKHANEYHDLRVQIDQPGITARTNTGYYNQP